MMFVVVLLLLGTAVGTNELAPKHVSLHSDGFMIRPMEMYRQDCGKKRPVALLQGKRNPGAGLSEVEPFSTVFMDGFMLIDCVKDYMFEHGDKFGNNKYVYEVGASSNVSIVLYKEVVPREDQKSMTHEVCFEFCRTVPEMGFFGITQGRECYCTPYFEQMAGDSSKCDSVCEGSPSTFCGGMAKSSVFSMHKCADAGENLADAAEALGDATRDLLDIAGEVRDISVTYEPAVVTLQERLGSVGDPVASDLMQTAKVFAGKLVHPAEENLDVASEQLGPLRGQAMQLVPSVNNGDFESLSQAEQITQAMKTAAATCEEKIEELQELKQLAQPTYSALENAPNASAQYHPLMYFVDKNYETMESTCGGDLVKEPLFGLNVDECATACDANIHTCVGFSFFPEGVCFMFSKFKSVTYYTGCARTAAAAGFLEKRRQGPPGGGPPKVDEEPAATTESAAVSGPPTASAKAQCYAKFTKFEGTTLKPDPSGKCELCLKTATKADRCF